MDPKKNLRLRPWVKNSLKWVNSINFGTFFHNLELNYWQIVASAGKKEDNWSKLKKIKEINKSY